jgi:hypothetical protein
MLLIQKTSVIELHALDGGVALATKTHNTDLVHLHRASLCRTYADLCIKLDHLEALLRLAVRIAFKIVRNKLQSRSNIC